MTRISPPSLSRNGEVGTTEPSIAELREIAVESFAAAVGKVCEQARAKEVTFRAVELEVRDAANAVGRALLVLFLALREEQVMEALPGGRQLGVGRSFRRAPSIARNLTTLFGVVRYWRTYMREVGSGKRSGYHPLDLSLGLGVDRFSWNVLSRAVRLATELSFARAKHVLGEFIPNAPSTEVLERATLGFGAHAEAFFSSQAAPDDDGEVLIIEIDGKAVPTATESELMKRRGKRPRGTKTTSPRHRGRKKRARHPKGPRRKKGDKSKNGKGGTMVVMYTLRRVGTRRLEGPVNRRHYVTFASKRTAFAFARAQADKRGFGPDAGRQVELLTDGDNDLARFGAEYLPHARHTIDAYHVFERLWQAAAVLFVEGSDEAKSWVDEQKHHLFHDDPEAVLLELQRRYELIPKTGPGTKKKRERLAISRTYLAKRVEQIRYGIRTRRDLPIGTGIVEGAIKFILAKRCDHGGMRWIKERVQAVAQLRCIDANGDWNTFVDFVHQRQRTEALLNNTPARLQQPAAEPLRYAA